MTATVTRIDIAARFRHWVNAGRPVLRDLAAVYRDHPDHRPEWKP